MNFELLVHHVKKSIEHAMHNCSKLSSDILDMEGMSGFKNRHLYNNLCSLGYLTYVEVGTWKGSSFLSAMYHNNVEGICIDNWSEFGGPKNEFLSNVGLHLTKENIRIIDKDCWSITSEDLPKPIDIYLYDGPHTFEDHRKAITHYSKFFSEYVIIIIDDWMCDWADVKSGTMAGFAESNLTILFKCEIPLVNTNLHHQRGDTFWNGCGIFICSRASS